MIMNGIEITDLGLTDYREARTKQLNTQSEVIAGRNDIIFLTEHYDVYTLGKHGHEENLLSLPAGVECIRIERGGDITYHGPGQLVVYPIINLPKRKLGIKAYVSLLEESVIRTLSHYGIKSDRVEGATGVWLGKGTPGERKICAIGVKVTRGVTMHGLALNVNTRLSGFSAINPCGFVDKGVTSIAAELGEPVSMAEVKELMSRHLADLLNSGI